MKMHKCGFGLLSSMIGVAKAGGIVSRMWITGVLFPNQQSQRDQLTTHAQVKGTLEGKGER